MIRDEHIKCWARKHEGDEKKEAIKILGVEYAHIKMDKEGDLYVTKYGLPFVHHLDPNNFWKDDLWFKENSKRLSGTSSIYKVRTKEVGGTHKDIVVKWNRMGQDVPGLDDDEEFEGAEFNSPFEEFSLVMELKQALPEKFCIIKIQRPLAIYVPSEKIELDRSGRKEYKMLEKIALHKEVALDMMRPYAVIYEWIEGIDSAEALEENVLNEAFMRLLTLDADKRIKKEGFEVKDNKPHHIIVDHRKEEGLKKDDKGNVIYGLVDFELLGRTQKWDDFIKRSKRTDYLKRQRDRFQIEIPNRFHPHLHHVRMLGVDYVYGNVESTKGRLWVVGKDPYLFDYFLPERWRNIAKTKISLFSEMYHVVTKDDIHLIWKLSKVGLKPDMDPFKEDEEKILEYGYNSPFEEFTLAVELNNKGIPSIYPRAIYMSENETNIPEGLLDNSRYESHNNYKTPEGLAFLKKGRSYTIIWGYWNGPDEKLADKDGDYYEGIDILRAYKQKVITQKEYIDLLKTAKDKLQKVGVEDLNLRGNHILISFDSKGEIVLDSNNTPEIRICNFEFLKKIPKNQSNT